ncbi:MAG: restriction endonuclease [Propionibacteriaceae bacterium]|nr:restriction endonuclease [Propionibacteriaceae bacterium]
MDLDELLQIMDRTAANLAKLEAVWQRAEPMIPSGPARGSSREYEDLRRTWNALLPGLPAIDGWSIDKPLPDIDAAGQAFIDYFDIGEPAFDLMNALEEPGDQLAEYRFRLGQARRRAIRDRLTTLARTITDTLPKIIEGVPRDSSKTLDDERITAVKAALAEIEGLLGDTIERSGRWGDMHRHMHFSQGHDWHDIAEMDWPSIRVDLEAASLSEADPFPVPDIDLGKAASAGPAGGISTAILWPTLDADAFERLLFELFRGFPSYQNVDWLMKTRAPDRSRDLSAERVIRDDGGTIRIERVVIQAKHWTSRSVAATDIHNAMAALPIWEPPVIRGLIVATSGRFTSDAVAVAEKHNADGKMPYIELWPDSRLETLLSERPDLIATYALRSGSSDS